MKSKPSQRKRGVILSSQGWQKLQAAIAKSEHRDNSGEKYTVQQLGYQAGLDPATISKVLDREKSVDRRTIERFFRVFDLDLDDQDYDKLFLETNFEDCPLHLALKETETIEQMKVDLPVHLLRLIATARQNEQSIPPENEIDFPGSPLSYGSPIYVERPEIEDLAYKAIINPGALIRIKSPEKWGKTSMMNRILAHARAHNYQTVHLNIQQAESEILISLERFLRWLCANIASQLNLEARLDDYWDADLGSKISCTTYLQGFVLPQVESCLVLALDEVHRIFEFPQIAQDFLSMLRVWYEEGKNLSAWKKLHQVVSYATEVYIPLELNQSPFNVGLPIGLQKFDLEQAQSFAIRHGLDLSEGEFGSSELVRLHAMVDGHPYLLHLAFYSIAYQNVNVTQLFDQASTQTGIYSDHLRRYLTILQEQSKLASAFKEVLMSDDTVRLETISAYKLESMGLVRLQGDRVTLGCELYRSYFCEHWDQF
jgi:hypothetical protein